MAGSSVSAIGSKYPFNHVAREVVVDGADKARMIFRTSSTEWSKKQTPQTRESSKISLN
jgi:hypothetical protein